MEIKTPVPQPGSGIPPAVAPDLAVIRQLFPNVSEKIGKLWGSEMLQEYLGKTIFDERGGRQGFPVPVVMALERIFENHSKLFPQASTDPFWDGMTK